MGSGIIGEIDLKYVEPNPNSEENTKKNLYRVTEENKILRALIKKRKADVEFGKKLIKNGHGFNYRSEIEIFINKKSDCLITELVHNNHKMFEGVVDDEINKQTNTNIVY